MARYHRRCQQSEDRDVLHHQERQRQGSQERRSFPPGETHAAQQQNDQPGKQEGTHSEPVDRTEFDRCKFLDARKEARLFGDLAEMNDEAPAVRGHQSRDGTEDSREHERAHRPALEPRTDSRQRTECDADWERDVHVGPQRHDEQSDPDEVVAQPG